MISRYALRYSALTTAQHASGSASHLKSVNTVGTGSFSALLHPQLLTCTRGLEGHRQMCSVKTLKTCSNEKKNPDQCGSVGWASSHKAKGCQFNSRSGHRPGLWVQSPVGACEGQPIDVSPPLFLPPFPSL